MKSKRLAIVFGVIATILVLVLASGVVYIMGNATGQTLRQTTTTQRIPTTSTSTNQTKPLAIVLDFGNSYINYSFQERFFRGLSNVSQLHLKVLIISMDSIGGIKEESQTVGEFLRFYCKVVNVTCYWYVPHLCKSGCFLASSYLGQGHVFTSPNASWYWGHTRSDMDNQTWNWAALILSQNFNQSRSFTETHLMATPNGAPLYPLNEAKWSSFLSMFGNYNLKIVKA